MSPANPVSASYLVDTARLVHGWRHFGHSRDPASVNRVGAVKTFSATLAKQRLETLATPPYGMQNTIADPNAAGDAQREPRHKPGSLMVAAPASK